MRWSLLLLPLLLMGAAWPPELGRRGMVAADERQCSEAGASALAAGGNAVDAAIAAALACGVTQPAGSGLGGGGFAVVVEPDGQSLVLDFREVAPAAARREMFMEAAPGASTRGGLAVAVPSEGPGLRALHQRKGRLPWARVVEPARRLAGEGFDLGWHLDRSLGRLEAPLRSAVQQGLFGRTAPALGERATRPALARALGMLARDPESFRRGEVAQDIAAGVKAAGGILTEADLAAVAPRDRAPLKGSYRGWTVITMPPPSSGGAILLQLLAVLEGSDLKILGAGSAALWHLEAEAMKHAYADRAKHMGDPERVKVPIEQMLDPTRVAEIRTTFDPQQTFGPERYGTRLDIGKDGGTQHISVIDQEGRAVALTTTINTSFGSAVFSPRFGLLLNNQMDDFVARPGQPNAFGLVGSEANAVAPGARPLSSMSPTVLISPDGRRRIAVGASGGPFIISSTLQTIVHMIDFGMDPSAAVAAPRMHHQWTPNELVVDEGTPVEVVAALQARGHQVRQMPFFSAVEVVEWSAERQLGASDPRKGGRAAAP